ncbi:putative Histidine phosphatase superfamily (branch 2) [Monocercomonoides exilis]|uniref:putative Histidine phosphatase superfamily (branch 2) n=1 Tax=Monocercomonoides exilis TaxID=2049356 RepID=UPI00355A1C5B|nr:putative Histidine phosphatase superfamily (branch 2) [Monocercomonoides exilis]|eukprot:MONOS_7615.1-p1 / transcript=MONOS_7615.1 / gene=MONOS_7615 / organism=Monocercomonoides_exilis_PA203 / gene_product=unspecified product / transcript_product=unspecified product / location=Mono_scaffold00265:13214-15551(+) / protein_length=561 / sequence_SO=supercontig / SO=protein_coding / is_pseudo=false
MRFNICTSCSSSWFINSLCFIFYHNIYFFEGDRGPLLDIPKYIKPGLPGELTVRGMKQHKAIGKFIRDHYKNEKNFLSETYKSSEIYVRASNYNRCLQSAWSQLAGLYEKANGPNGMRAIPMQTELQEEELLLRGYEVSPPALTGFDNYKKSSDYDKIAEEIKPDLTRLSEIIEFNVTMEHLEFTLDSMFIQDIYGKLSDEEKEIGIRLADAMDRIRQQHFYYQELSRAKAGLGMLFQELFVDNVKDDLTLLDQPESTPLSSGLEQNENHTHLLQYSEPTKKIKHKKFRLYSAHDTTLYTIMYPLQIPTYEKGKSGNPRYRKISPFYSDQVKELEREEREKTEAMANGQNSTSPSNRVENLELVNPLPYYAAILLIELHVPRDENNKLNRSSAFFRFFYQINEAKARKGELWTQVKPARCSSIDCSVTEFENAYKSWMVPHDHTETEDPSQRFSETVNGKKKKTPPVKLFDTDYYMSEYEKSRKESCGMDKPNVPLYHAVFPPPKATVFFTLIGIFSVLAVCCTILDIFLFWAWRKRVKAQIKYEAFPSSSINYGAMSDNS